MKRFMLLTKLLSLILAFGLVIGCFAGCSSSVKDMNPDDDDDRGSHSSTKDNGEEEESTDPDIESTAPSADATEPSTEATDPSTEATEPSTEATEPSTAATEPSTEPTEPAPTIEVQRIDQVHYTRINGDEIVNVVVQLGYEDNALQFVDKYEDGILILSRTYDGSIERMLTQQEYDQYGSMVANQVNTYDENGNLLEELEYKYGTLVRKRACTYDENGNRLTSDTYEDGEKKYSAVFRYDENDNRIEYVFYARGEEHSRTTYKYDEKGNETERIDYEDGIKDTSWAFVYDENGNVTEQTYFNYKYNYIQQYYYTYNSDGDTLSSACYDGGTQTQNGIWEYDDNGNLLSYESWHYYADEDKTVTYSDMYTYDARGNQITAVHQRDGEETNRYIYTYGRDNFLSGYTQTRDGIILQAAITYDVINVPEDAADEWDTIFTSIKMLHP